MFFELKKLEYLLLKPQNLKITLEFSFTTLSITSFISNKFQVVVLDPNQPITILFPLFFFLLLL